MFVMVSLPLLVAHVVHACDVFVSDICWKQMVFRLDLLLEGVVDGENTRLEVVSFSSFSYV